MHQSYRFAIAYFAIFGMLLLLSGTLLFISKLGLSYESVSLFYLGNPEKFIMAKSSYGLLEIALPHLGAMGLFIFVTGHFLLFSSKKEKQKAILPVIVLFIAALLDIASGFMIIKGWTFFVGVKIIAFLSLQLIGLYLLWVLFSLTFKGIQKYRTS